MLIENLFQTIISVSCHGVEKGRGDGDITSLHRTMDINQEFIGF